MLRDDEPGFELWSLVRSIYRTALKRLNARLAKEKISFSQYSVLLALARNGPMQMSILGEHMLVAPANVTGLVDRMEKKGWVVRKRNPNDRRAIVIETTPLGEETFRKISGRFRAYVRSIGQDLTEQELESTLRAMKTMMARVESTREI